MDAFNIRAYRHECRARQRIIEEINDELEIMRARHKAEIEKLYTRRDEELRGLNTHNLYSSSSVAAGGGH